MPNGPTVEEFLDSVSAGDIAKVRSFLGLRPDLVHMDRSGGDEHRALHCAVLRKDPAMVRLLMEAGADARKGIFPHREPTSAFAIARDRGYSEISAIIEREEQQRRREMSCPNATVTPAQDEISAEIRHGDAQTAIDMLTRDKSLIHACDRTGSTPLHIAAAAANEVVVTWLLQNGANVRHKDVNGFTPLDSVALAADPRNYDATGRFPSIARQLLERGAEVTVRGAVALADEERVRALIEAEPAALREIHRGGGLVTIATNHGHAAMVKLLLDLGADVDERLMLAELEEPTLSWGYPLWHAALGNQYEIAKLLLDHGADPNANVYASGWPLRNAWHHPDGRLKALLLERGAKLQPYMISETHDVEKARALLDADSSEELAQELAWSAADSGCAPIVALSLPHLKWDLSDKRWHWILIQPVRGASDGSAGNEGHFSSMGTLLQYGINPNISRFGQTILHFTVAHHSRLPEQIGFVSQRWL